jgi:hypothetical protein
LNPLFFLVIVPEHRSRLVWNTIQMDLERAEAMYSSFHQVLKIGVPRSTFPFLAPFDPGTR